MITRIIYFLMLILLFLSVVVLSTIKVCIQNIEPYLSNVSMIEYQKVIAKSLILSDDKVVETFSDRNSDPITIDNIPWIVKHAFISAEDKNFYTHDGLDYEGILRALFYNIQGKHMFGASTITQQVIKNLITGNDRTISRKIKEALLARRLEKTMDKDKILEIYLNSIWLGAGSYGVNSASKTWFNKPLSSLNPSEVAWLAGLPKGPALFDPLRHPDRAHARRHYVLQRMCEDHIIECSSVIQWDKEPLPTANIINNSGVASDWYEETVRRHILDNYGSGLLYSGGLTIDEWKNELIQKKAEQALKDGIKSYMLRHPKNKQYPNGSIIVMDSQTGHVLAEVGGINYSAGFDRAIQSRRQIGSIAKTIVTATALTNGYDENTDIMDVPIHISDVSGIWSPGADGGDGLGLISITKALSESRNQAFVRIAYDIGFDKIYEDFYKYGLYSKDTNLLPASILGAIETTSLNVAVAYSRAINGGIIVNPEFIKDVRRGDKILESSPEEFNKFSTIDISDKLKKMLHSVVIDGTAYEAFKNIGTENIGGKTGTSNNVMDSWFAGYKNNYVIVVHVGYDIPQNMGEHEFGSTIAGPIASDIMKNI